MTMDQSEPHENHSNRSNETDFPDLKKLSKEITELKGHSLLQTVNQRISSNDTRPTITSTRIIFTGKYIKTVQEIADAVHALVGKLCGGFSVTGGVIIFERSKLVFGFMEAPPLILYDFLKAQSCLLSLRILSATEDCPERDLKKFSVYVTEGVSEVGDAEEGNLTLGECLSRIVSGWIDKLSKMMTLLLSQKVDCKSNVIQIPPDYRDHMPPEHELKQFVMIDYFPDVDEFLLMYQKPLDFQLDNELLWPTEYDLDWKQITTCTYE